MENIINKTQKTYSELRADAKRELQTIYKSCKTNEAFLAILNKILDSNLETLGEIVSKMKNIDNKSVPETMRRLDTILNKLSNSEKRNRELKLEKDTLILITDQRNRNIEMYYVIYIVFIVLFIIIQTSIIIFK